jgi:hypothetical protein
MSLYIDPKNQELLWKIFDKHPPFKNIRDISFKQNWFKNIIEMFYENNKHRILTPSELQTLNRGTIAYMMEQLKISQNVPVQNVPIQNVPVLSSTNGIEERTQIYNDQFSARQKEYEKMLAKPPPPELPFNEKIGDEAITNMDELIRRQIEMRELDIKNIQGNLDSSKKIEVVQEKKSPNLGDLEKIEIANLKKQIELLTDKYDVIYQEMQLLKKYTSSNRDASTELSESI